MMHRVFLLSPAHAGGVRARMLLNEQAGFDLAVRLRSEGATIGEVFSFVSGLYFRGKLAYSEAFANAPEGIAASRVITPGRGLIDPATPITHEEFRSMATVPVDPANPSYLEPLARDALQLESAAGKECAVVLLGSIATAKYTGPLIEVFGERLLFPLEFVGRGDMSRGGLMLQSVRTGSELTYVSAMGATLRGKRPPRLNRLTV